MNRAATAILSPVQWGPSAARSSPIRRVAPPVLHGAAPGFDTLRQGRATHTMTWWERLSLIRKDLFVRGLARETGAELQSKSRGQGLEFWLYAAFAAGCIWFVGNLFYGALRLQLAYAQSYSSGDLLTPTGIWSAPLDDVFIHFDFARSTARGYAFQWSEGNGYSSGGTSLLYPFVLAFGYWVGFRSLNLMLWAAIVACICTLGFLLGARRLFSGLPRWTAWLAPPVLLCVGALDWSLFSGMEVALFLGLWGAALVAWDDLVRQPELYPTATKLWPAAARLGLSGALLVATRPESALIVALFGCSAAYSVLKRQGNRSGLITLVWSGIPAFAVLLAHAVANKLLTGDSTAAGALVKVEMYHPHLSREQVWDAWAFNLKYQVLRITHYHLSEQPGWGWILWGLGALALVPRRTRKYALLLWLSATAWVLVVALNGQVRWQNERYTMPALAWLLMLAALGLGGLLSIRPARASRGLKLHLLQAAIGILAATLFMLNQLPRFREQVWFFGRASRNIRDQHLTAGTLLKQLGPKRVLVGDAGALTYRSDLPGLDIIGLGGYHDLPFARASQWGAPAALELVERMPAGDRPQAMAIYPSWWGTLPLWFGDALAHVPVRGNVICGGADKVIYRANWQSFQGSALPFRLAANESVSDELDLADLVNEKQHQFAIQGALGFVTMKMLPNPEDLDRDLWDAGRIVPQGSETSFKFSGDATKPGRLVVRAAQATRSVLEVFANDVSLGQLTLEPSDGWREFSLEVPSGSLGPNVAFRMKQLEGERILYHIWLVQEGRR